MMLNIRVEVPDDAESKWVLERLQSEVHHDQASAFVTLASIVGGYAGLVLLATTRVPGTGTEFVVSPVEQKRIALDYKAGETLRMLSERTGYSYGTIHNVLKLQKVKLRARNTKKADRAGEGK